MCDLEYPIPKSVFAALFQKVKWYIIFRNMPKYDNHNTKEWMEWGINSAWDFPTKLSVFLEFLIHLITFQYFRKASKVELIFSLIIIKHSLILISPAKGTWEISIIDVTLIKSTKVIIDCTDCDHSWCKSDCWQELCG